MLPKPGELWTLTHKTSSKLTIKIIRPAVLWSVKGFMVINVTESGKTTANEPERFVYNERFTDGIYTLTAELKKLERQHTEETQSEETQIQGHRGAPASKASQEA